MEYIRLILKSDKNINDIIKKLELKKKNSYSFQDLYYLNKDGSSVSKDNIVIRSSEKLDKYLVIKNESNKVVIRKEFDTLEKAKEFIKDKYSKNYDYKFKIDKTGKEYKNSVIRLWVDKVDGLGTTVAIKGNEISDIKSLFDYKDIMIEPLEEYMQGMINKIRGNTRKIKYEKNILGFKGLIELTSFVMNKKRYLNDKKKLNSLFVILTLLVLVSLGLFFLIKRDNTLELIYGIGFISVFMFLILILFNSYSNSKRINRKYTGGFLEVTENYIKESHDESGSEYLTKDIHAIYVGKYSIFILLDNTNVFYYFSIKDKAKVLDSIKTNFEDVKIKRL